jgi:hypothetical protein
MKKQAKSLYQIRLNRLNGDEAEMAETKAFRASISVEWRVFSILLLKQEAA